MPVTAFNELCVRVVIIVGVTLIRIVVIVESIMPVTAFNELRVRVVTIVGVLLI